MMLIISTQVSPNFNFTGVVMIGLALVSCVNMIITTIIIITIMMTIMVTIIIT